MRRALRAVVSGLVQGVGFRYFVQRLAWHCDVSGWCRNRRDGTVEIVAAGEGRALESFLAGVGEGPPGASVEAVDVTPSAGEPPDGFHVLRTE